MTSKDKKGSGLIWLIVLIAIVVAAIVGYLLYQANTEQNVPADNQESSTETEDDRFKEVEEIVITTGDSDFGTMLFNDAGQAIYIWELEESSEAECYDDCAEAWPPVLTDGQPVASGDVKSKLLGTTERTDGTTQVTYNDHPLYYYAHEGPGEVKCHNISTHGGLWWVIQPNGVRAD